MTKENNEESVPQNEAAQEKPKRRRTRRPRSTSPKSSSSSIAAKTSAKDDKQAVAGTRPAVKESPASREAKSPSESTPATPEASAGTEEAPKKRRRRGSRGRGRRPSTATKEVASSSEEPMAADIEKPASEVVQEAQPAPEETKSAPSRPSRSRRRRSSARTKSGDAAVEPAADKEKEAAKVEEPVETPETKESAEADAGKGESSETVPAEGRKTGRRRRSRRRSKSDGKPPEAKPETASGEEEEDATEPTLKSGSASTPKSEPVSPKPIKPGERVMLINVAEGEECRIAVLHQNRLEELFIERASGRSHVGNIYKGRVTNVEPSIQAAFIDFGMPKNGFLHISDLQPQYFPDGKRQVENVGRKTPRRERPPIQRCLRRGQEVIVQIIKEGIGTKGPTLTSYVSIPGRYLVMMPGMNRLGVSRKIEDEDTRRKMRRVLDELELPKDMGFILRTAGQDHTKRELQRDLLYLQRLWKAVVARVKNDRAPCELYQESDLVIRTIRDVYSSDFNRVIIDSEETGEKVRDFFSLAMPRTSCPVEVYSEAIPLFHKFGIESEIERLNQRYVPLPSGGSLVIDSTEALVAIDVNSGRFREHDDAEETAYRTNMEAVEEIARQLRLRDLGGLVLCDLIDMRLEKHKRSVEKTMRDALRKHKERAKCLRLSQFGIMEMTRQRMRPSIKRSVYQDCPHCRGAGLVKNPESMALDVIRLLRVAAHREQVRTVSVKVPPKVAFHLQNSKRATLYDLERETNVQIIICPDRTIASDQYVFECLDQRGGVIRVIDRSESQASLPSGRSRHGEKHPSSESDGFEDMFD